MNWSKLQKQLYLIIDKESKFQIHCSIYKTKSAWTAGQKQGISKGREMIPRFWITISDKNNIIWDFPNNFLESKSQIQDNLNIKDTYFHPNNYTWVSECIRYYLDIPKDKLLIQKYEKDNYGLTEILRKYDRRISKKIRENL